MVTAMIGKIYQMFRKQSLIDPHADYHSPLLITQGSNLNVYQIQCFKLNFLHNEFSMVIALEG